MNAIELLRNDHKKVRGLLSELVRTASSAPKRRRALLEAIVREVDIHTRIEEEIFYPAFKAAATGAGDGVLYFEAMEEHRAAGDLVLPDLQATDANSEQFAGRAKVLKDMIEHHADEEEDEMFPRAIRLLGTERLGALGEQMAGRKRELMADPDSGPAKRKVVKKAVAPRKKLAAKRAPAQKAPAKRAAAKKAAVQKAAVKTRAARKAAR